MQNLLYYNTSIYEQPESLVEITLFYFLPHCIGHC